jgi:hypothetical protein
MVLQGKPIGRTLDDFLELVYGDAHLNRSRAFSAKLFSGLKGGFSRAALRK